MNTQIKFYKRFSNTDIDIDAILRWYEGEGEELCVNHLGDEGEALYELKLGEGGAPLLLGEGSNAHAFILKGESGSAFENHTIKVFFPKIHYATSPEPLLCENYRLKSPSHKQELAERLERFILSYDNQISIKEAYDSTDRTAILFSELYFSSLGICYVSTKVGGELLQDYLDSKPSTKSLLTVSELLLNDLAVHHEQGIFHADIKPANLWCINSDKKSIESGHFEPSAVRSLDFGSACNADETIEDIKYLCEKYNSESDFDSNKSLSILFFESTSKYYSHKTQREIIKMLILNKNAEQSKQRIKDFLLSLDIVAAFKIIFYQLFPFRGSEEWKDAYNGMKSKLFTSIVADEKASLLTYHIGYLFKKIFDRCAEIDAITYKSSPSALPIISIDEALSWLSDLADIFEFGADSYAQGHHNLLDFDAELRAELEVSKMQELMDKLDGFPSPAELIKAIIIE